MAIMEHVIPINHGGAKLDYQNWMSVCKRHADKKNGLEAHANAPLVPFKVFMGERIPADRNDIIKLLDEHDAPPTIEVEQP